jgi:hypothetical protein
MISHSKEAFKKFEENAQDLLIAEDDDEEYTLEHREVCDELYKSYMDLLKIAKRLHRKKIYSISFLLMYVMTTIHHGPDDVEDALAYLINYYNVKAEKDDPKYLNLFDEKGNRLKIEDLDKL